MTRKVGAMRCRRLVACLGMVLAVGAGLVGPADPGLASARQGRADPDNNTFTSDILTGVSALSPTDVWVVGNHPSSRSDYQPVIRRFDGEEWTRMGRLAL